MYPQAIRNFYEQVVKKVFPPVRYAFAYGSAVVKQQGRPQGKMLDMIFAVDDPLEWHVDNLGRNPDHYSFMKHVGAQTIVSLQRASAGVYYNTLLTVESQSLKYGVVSTDDLVDDLLNWKWLYVSGRLHKPVVTLTDVRQGDILYTPLKYNRKAAAICGVLLQDSNTFNEEDLYTSITELSYNGDFRQWIGEDKMKVQLIVKSNVTDFSNIYHSQLTDLVEFQSDGLMTKRCDVSVDSQLGNLPDCVKLRVKNGQTLTEALRSIVRESTLKQSGKGILTAGISKTIAYSLAKLKKMASSYRR